MISWQRCWLVEHVITSNWNHPPWRSGIRPWPKSQGEEVQWHWDRLAEKNLCIEWCNWPASFSNWIQACLTQGGGLQICQNVTEQLIFKRNTSLNNLNKSFPYSERTNPTALHAKSPGVHPIALCVKLLWRWERFYQGQNKSRYWVLNSIHNLDIL